MCNDVRRRTSYLNARATLDKVGQQNASASEQVSSTSEELASQAEQLQLHARRIAGVAGERLRDARRHLGAQRRVRPVPLRFDDHVAGRLLAHGHN